MMMPTRPTPGLVFVQPHVALLRLELRFNAPPGTAHVCQSLQRRVCGSVGQVVAGYTILKRQLFIDKFEISKPSRRSNRSKPQAMPKKDETTRVTKPPVRKKRAKTARKPAKRTASAKTPMTAEARAEARRERDRTRSQNPERKEYMRLRAQERRRRGKAAGLCRSCSNPSIPGETRCPSCAEKHRELHMRSRARRKAIAEQRVTTEG